MPKIKNGNAKPIMTATRYKKILKRLGMSQVSAARFIGVNDRTSRRFASGQYPVPRATALLLAIMAGRGISPEKAEKML